MAHKWILGNFSDGTITDTEVKVEAGSSAEVDILGSGSASITVPIRKLNKPSEWKQTFRVNQRLLALIDDEQAWDSPNAVVWAGFVNDVRASMRTQSLTVRALELPEYLKARKILGSYGRVTTNPDASKKFTGSGWAGVIGSIIRDCFSAEGLPADAPKPPQILGTVTVTDSDTTAREKIVSLTEALSYSDALNQVKETDSPDGREWAFTPRFASESMDRIVWDVLACPKDAPHFREKRAIEMVLEENEINKFSEYGIAVNGADTFNGLHIQSKAGQVGEGGAVTEAADLTGSFSPGSAGQVLFEEHFSPGVELSATQLTEQLTARVRKSAEAQDEIELSFEEEAEKAYRITQLGSTIKLIGKEGTVSEGWNAEVRLTSVSFNVDEGSVRCEVMAIAPSYPRLPKDRKDLSRKYDPPKSTFPKFKVPSGGGGGVDLPGGGGTDLPGGGGTDLPVLGGSSQSEDDKWGNAGYGPGDQRPSFKAPKISDYKAKEITIPDWDGVWPIDVSTITPAKGNAIYGLDKTTWAANTFKNGDLVQNWNGGVNMDAGGFNDPIPPLFIKRAWLDERGNMEDLKTIDKIEASELQNYMAPFDRNSYPEHSYWCTSFEFVIWSVMGRLYLAIRHSEANSNHIGGDQGGEFYVHTRATVIYKKIDSKSGDLVGPWVTDPIGLPDAMFPRQWGISVYGDNVIFGLNSVSIPHGVSFKNLSNDERRELFTDFNEKHGYAFKYFRQGQWLPLPHLDDVSNLYRNEFPFNWISAGDPGTGVVYNHARVSRDFANPSASWNTFLPVGSEHTGNRGAEDYEAIIEDGGMVSRRPVYPYNVGRATYTGGNGISPNESEVEFPISGPEGHYNLFGYGGWVVNRGGWAFKMSDALQGVSTFHNTEVVTELDNIALDYRGGLDIHNLSHFNPAALPLKHEGKNSKIINFRGRAYVFHPSAQNKIVARSIRMSEANVSPSNPPVEPYVPGPGDNTPE